MVWWRTHQTCTYELVETTCGSPSFARRLSPLSKLPRQRPPEDQVQARKAHQSRRNVPEVLPQGKVPSLFARSAFKVPPTHCKRLRIRPALWRSVVRSAVLVISALCFHDPNERSGHADGMAESLGHASCEHQVIAEKKKSKPDLKLLCRAMNSALHRCTKDIIELVVFCKSGRHRSVALG